ncbi:PREDICTED: zinc finger CCCH domain-containing protein 2 [Tarenaya hassleriana]|uniref:zinc finger CCCH domain-containing protein 2 n=1 Tax=Tarenaya hassleriana TaxID=28532 RepID=UPI00053C3605|nr:PREDICTED: zinc finger CCCH domain-containing protein 2 [Tarenaya hassleriana]
MEAICTEQHRSGHVRRPTVEIPPRKLLLSAKTAAASPGREHKLNWNKTNKIPTTDHDSHSDNDSREYCYDSDSDDPYAADHFRMYEFKIRRCTRSRSHDWTDCPFAHPGEKARRRDPRRYSYSGEVCPEYRRGGDCSRGDDCSFAHGVFECWLHPSRYRTEACKDGKHCKRKVCFFAHSPRQLRVLPPEDVSAGSCGDASMTSAVSLSPASVLSGGKNRCCLFCHHGVGSPTSPLLGLSHLTRSPSVSPPLSPAKKTAVLSRLRSQLGSAAYKDVLSELMSSLDSMTLAEVLAGSSSPVTTPVATSSALISAGTTNHRVPWLDVGFGGERDIQQQQQSHLQFAFSPSSPSFLNSPKPANLFSDDSSPHGGLRDRPMAASAAFEDGCGVPDLGWVNDLLT